MSSKGTGLRWSEIAGLCAGTGVLLFLSLGIAPLFPLETAETIRGASAIIGVAVAACVYQHEEKAAKRLSQSRKHGKQKNDAGLTGIDKYTAACDRVIADAEDLVKSSETLTKANFNRMYAKADTTDWAIAGGFAEGIAGPAAGLAVALDTQRQNEEAELRAAQTRQDAKDNSLLYIRLERRTKERLENLKKLKNEVVAWLTAHTFSPSNTDMLFDTLTVTIDNQRFDESGVMHVDVYAYSSLLKGKTTGYKIKGKPVILDGSLRLKVKSNGKVVGDGYYSNPTTAFEEAFRSTQKSPMIDDGPVQKSRFPLADINDWFTGFTGDSDGPCTDVILIPFEGNTLDPKKKYTIEVEPYELWVIEKD